MDNPLSPIPVSLFPPLPATWADDSHRQLDEIGETLYATEKAVFESMAERLAQIERTTGHIEASTTGDAGLQISNAEAAIKKTTDKIVRSMNGTAGALHERLAKIGIFPPSMPEVRYRLSSGDLFGQAGANADRFDSAADTSGTSTTADIDSAYIPDNEMGNSNRGIDSVILETPSAEPVDTVFGPTDGEAPKAPPGFPAPGPGGPIVGAPCASPIDVPPEVCGVFGLNEPGYTNKSNWTSDWNNRFFRHQNTLMARPLHPNTIIPDGEKVCTWSLRHWGTPGGPILGQGFEFKLPAEYLPRTDCGTLGFQLVWGRNDLQLHCRTSYALVNCDNVAPPPGPLPPKPPEKPGPEVCAVLEDKDCPPPKKGPIAPQGDIDGDPCVEIQKAIDKLGKNTPHFAEWVRVGGMKFPSLPIIDEIIKGLTGQDQPVIPVLIQSLANWMQEVTDRAVVGFQCDRGKLLNISILHAILRFMDKWFGIIPPQALSALEHVSNTVCRHILPPGASADMAFLRGEIDEPTWECWHKAAGHFIDEARKVMRSGRSKLDPTQLDKLFRREKLNQQEYDDLMREAGVLEDEDKRNIHNYNEAFPTASDAVTMLNRDVGDEVNVDWSKEDKLFDNGYKGRVQKYFEWNGYTRERALDQYRAHFHLPSYTMGMDFLHRFDDPELPKELFFDKEEFRKLLVRDDWSPAYIDRMIEAAYRPVTRSDTVKAYMIHAITDEEFTKRFKQTGYNADVTSFYLNFYKKNREIQDKRRSGLPTLRTLVNQYARCEITDSQFRDTVSQIVTSEEQEKYAIESAKLAREVRERQQTIGAVRGDYLVGVIDDAEAMQFLNNAGIDPSCVSALLDNWRIARLRRSKRASAAQLCKWRWYGIINASEQAEALVRVGWSEEDALRIAAECTAYISEKAAKQAASAAEKAMSNLRRRQREQEKLDKLIRCGPPACPSNTPGGQKPKPGGPTNQGPLSNGMASNGHTEK